MHPQMQEHFASYVQEFVKKMLPNYPVQIILTSHSPHIANTLKFKHIRYAQKRNHEISYLNLNEFCKENTENLEFIQKYLTLSKCDIFFADKIILVEGASERLLLPDMIEKMSSRSQFNEKNDLKNQYYTIAEIGGAYAYKFFPLIKFINVPCLVLTDIDSVDSNKKKCLVSKGKHTSNATIKNWFGDSKITINNLLRNKGMKAKTHDNIHIEYQTTENGLCGRSLEEALNNVNRDMLRISEERDINEEDLEFKGSHKTEFALYLIYTKKDYTIPKYISDGLIWLSKEG